MQPSDQKRGSKLLIAFVVLSSFLVISQLVSQEAIAGLEAGLQLTGLAIGPAVCLTVVIFVAVVWTAYCLTQSMARPSTSEKLLLVGLAFVALVSSNVMPAWGFQALGCTNSPNGVRLVAFLVLLFVWGTMSLFVLPEVQEWFRTPIDLAAKAALRPPSGPASLIALVSRSSGNLLVGPEGTRLEVKDPQAVQSSVYDLECKSLSDDVHRLNGSRWPWQQLLRAIRPYAGRPGFKILLLGSRTTGKADQGSHEQLGILVSFLKKYPELHDTTIEAHPVELDFENFDQVKDAIRSLIRVECARTGVAEGSVFVDITGGQKIASAAAAAATIGTKGQFQYVRTNDQDCGEDNPWNVIVSDLHPQAVPAAGS